MSILTVPRGIIPKDSVLIRGGKSAGVVAMPPGAAIVDAAGQYLMPGIINPNAHVTQKGATNERRVAVSSMTAVEDLLDSKDGALALSWHRIPRGPFFG